MTWYIDNMAFMPITGTDPIEHVEATIGGRKVVATLYAHKARFCRFERNHDKVSWYLQRTIDGVKQQTKHTTSENIKDQWTKQIIDARQSA